MRDTKGFTLVELLAVIVILAIVALVTTPAILNVINNSRQNAAVDKAWGTIDSVRLAYTQAQTNGYVEANNTDAGIEVADDASSITVHFSKDAVAAFDKNEIKMSGERPTGGTVTINLNTGNITCEDLLFETNGSYKCTTTDGNEMKCSKA